MLRRFRLRMLILINASHDSQNRRGCRSCPGFPGVDGAAWMSVSEKFPRAAGKTACGRLGASTAPLADARGHPLDPTRGWPPFATTCAAIASPP